MCVGYICVSYGHELSSPAAHATLFRILLCKPYSVSYNGLD
jgi:hypothetical protein